MNRALIFVIKSMKKLVKSQCYGVQMGIGTCSACYQYPFVPRSIAISRVFSWIFKPPQITNGNLILVVLLVESNTMVFLRESKDVQKQWMIESVLQSHYQDSKASVLKNYIHTNMGACQRQTCQMHARKTKSVPTSNQE